jgi:hypothetical protein
MSLLGMEKTGGLSLRWPLTDRQVSQVFGYGLGRDFYQLQEPSDRVRNSR